MRTLQKILLGVGVTLGVGAAGFGFYKILPETVVIRGEPVNTQFIDCWGNDKLYMIIRTGEGKLIPACAESSNEHIWFAKTLLDIKSYHKGSDPIEITGKRHLNDPLWYMTRLKYHDAEVRF